MKQRFEKGDRNLYSLSVTAAMIATILIIASVFFGIIYIVFSAKLKDVDSVLSITTLITGLVYAIVVPLFILIGYRLVMYFIWLSFDVKIIRNKLLGIEDTYGMLNICPKPQANESDQNDV